MTQKTHYDFNYHLRTGDIEQSMLTIDPYMVAKVWDLGTRDPSGCLFQVLKTIAKIKNDDSLEMDLASMELSLKRLREVRKVNEFEIDKHEYNL